MSSSQPFLSSSPFSVTSPRRRESRFTYKHLAALSQSQTTCPLRVIAHIDLDAFYAQCEMVRLGVPEDQPLAVQQWQGLIAINYPARKFGLNRHITSTEAQKLCPELIMQHVATWQEGDDKWAYREDSFKNMATQKVSLDPYRLESRKILATIKEALPAPPVQRVEKASIDEVFLDLSAQIHSLLLQRYPKLSGHPPYDDPTTPLPRPPTTALDWHTDALVDLDASQTEDDDPDWDDITMLIGSEIVRRIRQTIREKLQYTCSAGVARNKLLAKLGSGHRKPNAQTVVRNRAVTHFLSGFKFTKIRNLGGKLGDEVVALCGTDTVSELLSVPLETLKRGLGDDTGTWVYNAIRGEDTSDVNPRTQIKSMLSAKSFRPAINGFETAVRWLRIFAADIFSRCVEEGVLENRRRPRTINLHHRQGAQTRSKQAPIPRGGQLSEEALFELARGLLAQVVADGRAWPCANLSLSVGGFEDGVLGNRGIGGFLVRGEEARAMLASERLGGAVRGDAEDEVEDERERERPEKRRKLDNPGIERFFGRREESRDESEVERQHHDDNHVHDYDHDRNDDARDATSPAPEATKDSINEPDADAESDDLDTALLRSFTAAAPSPPLSTPPPSPPKKKPRFFPSSPSAPSSSTEQKSEPDPKQPAAEPPSSPTSAPQQLDYEPLTYPCPKCANTRIPLSQEAEHEDWHFAKDLAANLRAQERASHDGQAVAAPSKPTQPRGRRRGRPPGTRAGASSVSRSDSAGGASADAGNGSGSGSGRGRGRGRGRPPFGAIGAGVERGQRRLGFGSGSGAG